MKSIFVQYAQWHPARETLSAFVMPITSRLKMRKIRCEEGGGIPIDVLVCHFVCRLMSSTSLALASSSVRARHVSIESTASSLVMSPPVSARICAFMAVRSTSPMGGA